MIDFFLFFCVFTYRFQSFLSCKPSSIRLCKGAMNTPLPECHFSFHPRSMKLNRYETFDGLQRRNLRILYDAIGTLADAVGPELNEV